MDELEQRAKEFLIKVLMVVIQEVVEVGLDKLVQMETLQQIMVVMVVMD